MCYRFFQSHEFMLEFPTLLQILMGLRITIGTMALFQLRRTGLLWGKTNRFTILLETRSPMPYHHVTASSLDPTTIGTISRSRLRRWPREATPSWLARMLSRSRRHCWRNRCHWIVRSCRYWRCCRHRERSLWFHLNRRCCGFYRRVGR